MMSAASIHQMKAEAGARAAEERKEPFVFFDSDEVNEDTLRLLPFLGDYVPDGWEEIERFFADATGYGDEWKPALSVNQLLNVIKNYPMSSVGWAIVEARQFQVYVGVFRGPHTRERK